MSNSPSSLWNGPGGKRSSRSRTASLGRHSRTPLGVQTIGRFTSIGCSIMASRMASLDTPSSRRPSSAAGDFVSRSAVRGVSPAAAKRPRSWGLVHPSLQIFDHRRRVACCFNGRQNVARRSALGVVVDHDIHRSTSLPSRSRCAGAPSRPPRTSHECCSRSSPPKA